MKKSDWKTVDVPTLPRKNERWVAVVAHIRKNATSEIRKTNETSILDDEDNHPNTSIWADGNFSCNCNRHIFFEGAGDESEDDGEEFDHPCGDGEYSVNLENPVTGEIYYREFETKATLPSSDAPPHPPAEQNPR